jgi:hypothetical protein
MVFGSEYIFEGRISQRAAGRVLRQWDVSWLTVGKKFSLSEEKAPPYNETAASRKC